VRAQTKFARPSVSSCTVSCQSYHSTSILMLIMMLGNKEAAAAAIAAAEEEEENQAQRRTKLAEGEEKRKDELNLTALWE